MFIGARNVAGSPAQYWNGKVAEVAIWDGADVSGALAHLYTGPTAGKTADHPDVGIAPTHYWPLDNMATAKIGGYDLTSNGGGTLTTHAANGLTIRQPQVSDNFNRTEAPLGNGNWYGYATPRYQTNGTQCVYYSGGGAYNGVVWGTNVFAGKQFCQLKVVTLPSVEWAAGPSIRDSDGSGTCYWTGAHADGVLRLSAGGLFDSAAGRVVNGDIIRIEDRGGGLIVAMVNGVDVLSNTHGTPLTGTYCGMYVYYPGTDWAVDDWSAGDLVLPQVRGSLVVNSGTDRIRRTASLPSTTNFSMATWVKFNAQAGYQFITYMGDGTNWLGSMLHDSGDFFFVGPGGADPAFAPSFSTWYYVACSSSGTALTARIWSVAGSLLATSSTATVQSFTPNTMEFGNDDYAGGEAINGNLCYGRVWGAVLSQAEFEAEMFSEAPVRTANLNTVPRNTDGRDLGGNSYDWTLTNITTSGDYPDVFGLVRHPVATDNFNRANANSLGSNWTELYPTYGDMHIVGNTAAGGGEGVVGLYAAARWDGAGTFADDQYSKVTVTDLGFYNVNYWLGVVCRASADTEASRDFYFFGSTTDADTGQPKTTIIGKIVNGTRTVLGTGTVAWANGDTLALECEGTTIRGMRNGAPLGGVFTVIDTALTSGKPGVAGAGYYVIKMDDWEGGNLEEPSGIISLPFTLSMYYRTLGVT